MLVCGCVLFTQCAFITKQYYNYGDALWLGGGSVTEWLACWTQAQKGLGSNRSRDAIKLFTPIVPLFTKQRNW